MKSRLLKVCSMVIIIALLIQLLPLQALALALDKETPEVFAEAQDQTVSAEKIAPDEPATILGEITAKRTEFSKEYKLSNGLSLAVVYPEAVHYQKNGQWEDVDTTLTAKNGVFTAAASPWNVSFPQQLSKSKAITVELNGHTVSFGMAGELRGSADAKLTTSEMGKETATLTVAEMQTSNAQLQTFDYSAEKAGAQYPETVPDKLRSRLTYSNVYSNTNVVYDLTAHKLKESVVIAKYDPELQGYRYTLDTGKLVPVLNGDNSITLIDPATKEAVLNMPAPYMIDSAGEISNDVEVALSSDGSAYTLMYRLPAQWMADEARSWPVVLDPVVEAEDYRQNILDIFVAEDWYLDRNHGFLYTGYHAEYGKMRTYLQYVNLPPITSSDVIVNANLALWKCGGEGTAAVVEAHRVLGEWHSESITWLDQPGFSDIIEDYAVVGNNGSYDWVLTDLVRDWYTDENNGFMLKASDSVESGGTANWKGYYSIDHTNGDNVIRPYLYITFRNTNGLESYWDYTTHSAGRAGTGYVNNYSGNLVWVHNDIGFGGNRMPVSISHIYNANDCASNAFGMGNGWRTNYNQTVSPYTVDNNYYVWDDSDGTKHYFLKESEGVYKDEDNLNLTLTTTGSGTTKYKIVDQYGNASYFDTSGRLTKIENNQATKSSINITYQSSSSQLISTIKDGAGRTYNFSYTNGLLSKIIYKDAGSTEISYISFGYTGSKLTSVTYKDGEQVQYGYSGNYLTSCTDIDGYMLQYSYSSTDPKRVIGIQEKLTGATEGGSLSIQYAHNQTTLTDHNGNANILQFNDWGNVVSVQDGEGRAQYVQYARNNYKSDTAGKANQMRLSSKLQNTVINHFKDNSFEKGTAWSNLSEGVTNAVSGTSAVYGSKSLKMTATEAGGIRYTGGVFYGCDTFTFSAYVKTDSTAQAWLSLVTSTGMSATSEVLDAGSDWTRLQVTITPTENCYVYAQLMTGTAGNVYMDCVLFERAETASRFNLVDNGDFRYGEYNWTRGANFTSADQHTTLSSSATPHMSAGVYKMQGSPTVGKQLYQTVTVSGSEGDTFILGGWAKGDSVPLNNENRRFGLRLKFNYTDGTVAEDTIVSFNPATGSENKWQFASVPAVAKGTYSSVTVYLEYSYNANTAYFDGIQLFKEEFGSSYTYDEDGNVISVVDLQKQETKYEYDTDNNLTKIIQNSKAKVTYTYDDYHNVKTATTYEGIVYEFGYDTYGNNNSVSIANGENRITSLATYTTDGNRLASTTDALGKITTYSYNPNTNVLEWVKYPNDTDATRTEYTYDTMYRLATAVADIDANTTLSASYTYDNDLLTQITTGSTTYAFSYNGFSQRTGISIGSRNLATYTYTNDKNRYLSQLVYGNQDMVQYTYDNLGRVILETYEDGSTVSYGYDNNGALATVTDSETGIKTTYYYDFTDRIMKYVEKGTDYSHSVGYEYDTLNNLTHLVETINGVKHTTSYSYDEDNRVTSVATDDNTHTVTYDAYGRVSGSVITGAAITKSFSYVANSTQIKELHIRFGGRIHSWSFTYDDNGNILHAYEDREGEECVYTYDSANQLLSCYGNGVFREWTYDDSGNILSRREYSIAGEKFVYYSYTDSAWGDLLTSYDGKTITYDAIGNPLTYGNQTFTWQHGRQLVSMSDGTTTWEFTYDANGMRKSKTNGALTYTYIYNGSQLSQMTRSDGNSLYFTYDTFGYPATVNWNEMVYYYITNLQGDVVSIRTSTGDILVQYQYDPWGRLIATTGTMATTLGTLNPLTYRGYVYDHETNLYYLQSRYYSPVWGRFLNADALVATGQGLLGNNMFAYCRNNPVKRKDATGTDDVCVTNADENDNLLSDLGYVPSGGYANAYNSIDAGYHYGVDFSMASNSSLTTGGIYGNGYTAYGVYSNSTGSGYTSTSTTAACFVAGTLVQSEDDSKAIEDISVGDKVWAWDEKTENAALKEVVETYINETDELIHVFVNGEEIITTPTHPFYSPVKGWTAACKLRAGDILVLVNGEYVVVEKVQHEILEAPITVYNFQVEDYHTYYVSGTGILVHNTCSNPYGKKGGPAHQSAIAAIKGDLISRGYSVVEEYRVDTSGGHKNTRYLDIYATNGYDSFGIQVGRMTRSGLPVWRERQALSDITDSGISTVFMRYK